MHNKIVQLGDPLLRKKAKDLSLEEIKSVEIQTLIKHMTEIMREAPGVGLAAPQIGVGLQIAVIEDREEYCKETPIEVLNDKHRMPVKLHTIINPRLTITDFTKVYFFEGCLSIHGKCRITPRAKSVQVECLNENGEEQIIDATGWYARILQHEIDHLNGLMYIDCSDPKTEFLNDELINQKWHLASQNEIYKHWCEKVKIN